MKKYKSIVVTGGAGFIGSHIAARLMAEGYKVTVLDNLSTGCEGNLPKGAEFIKMDLGDKDAYGAIKNISCDALLHLAGQPSGEASFLDPLYDFKSHVVSTFMLLDWCRKKRADRFIYASSMSVYGDADSLPITEDHPAKPKTFYAAGKSAAEAYIRLYDTLGIKTTIFRLFSVYGPGQNMDNRLQGMISIYLSYMLEGAPVEVKGSKERFRDFIYVDDVCDAWMRSLEDDITYGKVYNVGSGRKTKVSELLNGLKEAFGDINYPVEYKGVTNGDQFGVVADISRIRTDTGWRPRIGLGEGLKKMVGYETLRQKLRVSS